jgi:hypothetical protein
MLTSCLLTVVAGMFGSCGARETLGQSILAATEEQHTVAPPMSTSWLNPFRWTNEQSTAQPKPAKAKSLPRQEPTSTAASAQSNSRSSAGLAGLNPFRWTNAAPAEVARQLPAPPKNRGSVQPPESVLPAIATDGPLQPKSIQQTSTTAVANSMRPLEPSATLRQPINWPPSTKPLPPPVTQASAVAPIPARLNNSGQGVNPFGWSNAAQPVSQDFGPNHVPLEQQPLIQVALAAKEPMGWSNDPRGQAQPREFMPPEEPSFGDAFQESLRYVQPGTGNTIEADERSFPPVGATDAEVIAWEKENLPWIRPFYWSNSTEDEIAFENDIPLGSPGTEFVPTLTSPFNWSNDEQPSNRPRPQTTPQPKPMIAPDVSRDTRRVAYLQGGESLPEPLPALHSDNEEQLAEELSSKSKDSFDQEGKGTLAEAEKIGEEPPESNTLQFLRADTVLLSPGEYQFDYGFTYTKFDTDFPIFVTDGMGVAVADAEFRIREFQVPLEIRYGLARRVQLFLNVPFGWANTEFTFPSFEEFENDGGLGDISFGGTFLLREHCQGKPDAILTFASSAPTGNDPFSPAGASPSAPSLGNGSWSLASNLLFVQNYDPIVVFYGFGTRQYFETEIRGIDFQPGGEYNYQMGVGFGVNSNVTFSTRFNGAYITEAELAGERIRGTISEPMTVTLAMTIAKCQKLIEPFVDIGLTDDASDARIGITWTR